MAAENEKYLSHLRRQLTFLQNSCDLFDSGCHDEGIRIATAIRVLIYDTRICTSILNHLGKKDDIKFLSTVRPLTTSNSMPNFFDGVHLTPVSPSRLETSHYRVNLELDKWCGQAVTMVAHAGPITRAEVILAAAHQDRGAHVKDELPKNYEHLIKGNFWMSAKSGNGHELTLGLNLRVLRQIGYEVLNSQELIALLD